MRKVLKPLGNDEVYDFGRTFYRKVGEMNSWRLWGAGYVIAGGMSDDSFHYFRAWIVGKGKVVFDIAMTDPDALGPHIDDPSVDNEGLGYVAVTLLKERGLDDHPIAGINPDGEPVGEPFDEETVAERFPRLATQFG
ncbi:Protein of unknown function [Granulicella rosea]|uniref:DUF4240 domain-containing protein n=2 Tax=Granulicella rosea TaxID=474952 RepID=A0A239LLF3_9BACT|nr:Protein of unknown function [Granulicella rosea]